MVVNILYNVSATVYLLIHGVKIELGYFTVGEGTLSVIMIWAIKLIKGVVEIGRCIHLWSLWWVFHFKWRQSLLPRVPSRLQPLPSLITVQRRLPFRQINHSWTPLVTSLWPAFHWYLRLVITCILLIPSSWLLARLMLVVLMWWGGCVVHGFMRWLLKGVIVVVSR